MNYFEIIIGVIAPLFLGIFLLIYGIRLRMGYHKTWYMKSWVRAGSNIYMFIPGGLMALLWGLAGIFRLVFSDDRIFIINRCLLGLGILSLVVGVIISFLRPSFIKPNWLRWLEKNHGDILHHLRKEANIMGYPHWENLTSTQAGLEAWVNEVRHKRGL